jgi:hypothetical protein
LFRPPYGYQSVASHLDAVLLGYQVVAWSVVAYDWLDHDAGWMADRMVNRTKPGSVILLHDVLYHFTEERYADRAAIIEAVDKLLERFDGRFRFITVPELFQHGRLQRSDWRRQADPDWLNNLKGKQGEPRRYACVGMGKCQLIGQ